jgi:hypothetical protein
MRAKSLGGSLVALCLNGCIGNEPPEQFRATEGTSPAAGTGGTTAATQPVPIDLDGPADIVLGAACDETRKVASDDEALLVLDPEILKSFSLQRVLEQIISTSTAKTSTPTITPIELLQRLFDTENADADAVFADLVHCNDEGNPAFVSHPGAGCGRVEGRLARSPDLLVPGRPDSFVPIALVNRFDLTPANVVSCGEYRIVYAKLSGKTDPNDRAFLIFEASLFNRAGELAACRPVAELWAALPVTGDVGVRTRQLEALFFGGVAGLPPVVHAEHFGFSGGCEYGSGCGQVRLGQGMQAPFEFRQFRLPEPTQGRLSFVPATDGGALLPELFGTSQRDRGTEAMFMVGGELATLIATDAAHIKVGGFPGYETGVSALDGDTKPDFAARLQAHPERAALESQLGDKLAEFDLSACPPDDPLTVETVLARTTAVSCAGCHAPERLLPPGRKLGCGVVWPSSLGEAHIDERGNLSEALTTVFLPRRAEVLSTFLQACDVKAVRANLQPVRITPILK